jgi:hypothetical protein
MTEMSFIEVDLGEKTVLIPSMKCIPAVDIMEVHSRGTDSIQQFMGMVSLLRKLVAPEFMEDFNQLTTDEMVTAVGQWIEKSNR